MQPKETAQPEHHLRRGLRDLVALSTLPAVWAGQDPRGIAQSLAQVLVTILTLDFALIKLRHPGDEPIETVYGDAAGAEAPAPWLREALGAVVNDAAEESPAEILDPSGENTIRIAQIRFGTTGKDGVLVAGSQRPDFPTEVERLLLGVGANQTAIVLQHRRSEEALREQNEALDTLLRVNTSLAAERDLRAVVQAVTDAGTELTHAAFGAFFYNVVGAGGDGYMLYALSGARREDFADFPMPRNTSLFGPTFRGEATIRIADVQDDPRYGHAPPHHGLPSGHLPVRSYLATPVVSRTGEVIGGLFFGHPDRGVFRAQAERLVEGLAAQAAIAIDNVRLYRSLQAELGERASAQEALRKEAERKDEFLAMLGHELRNPLAAISSSLQLLEHHDGSSEHHAGARRRMSRQVGHLNRMVDDLLDLSRISRGQILLHREALDLAAIVRQVLEDHRETIAEAEVDASIRLPPEPVPVDADRTRLSQALGNLIQNACKFTDPGGTVEVRVEASDPDVEVRVVDSGIGIESQDIERILDPFNQAPAGRARSGGGLGLGLAVVKSVADLHGGSVHALSDGPGTGATFILRLPLRAGPPVRPGEDRGPSKPVRAQADHHILIVEDHRDAAASLSELLRLHGHRVEVAHDGPTGLDRVRELHPDVVLCDIGLPGDMDGYDLARAVRSDPALTKVFLVALTGFGQEADRRRALEIGFDAHLTKPADPERLARLLAERR